MCIYIYVLNHVVYRLYRLCIHMPSLPQKSEWRRENSGQATLKGRFCSIAWVEWNGQHQVVMLDLSWHKDMLKRNQGTKNPGKISSNFLSSHAISCESPESSHIGGVIFCNKWDDRSFQQEHQCVFCIKLPNSAINDVGEVNGNEM